MGAARHRAARQQRYAALGDPDEARAQAADGLLRPRSIDAGAERGVLVIGEPECDAKLYPALPAARREARAVAARFGRLREGASDFTSAVKTLDPAGRRRGSRAERADDNQRADVDVTGASCTSPATASRRSSSGPSRRQRQSPQTYGAPRGVVLSDGPFLGPREIQSMRIVPELVFVNCCFLAARGIDQLLDPGEWRGRPYNRAQFAAGVADKLIEIGVRCVIAAGWAVEDGPANVFADKFYEALLEGQPLHRRSGRRPRRPRTSGGQHVGGVPVLRRPEWQFRPGAADAQRPRKPYGDEFASIASPESLVLALQTIGVNSEFNRASAEQQVDRMRFLETRFGAQWGDRGSVAAAFGHAWSLMGQRAKAIEWLTQARAAQSGTAPLESMEELANLLVREAWETVQRAASGSTRKATLAAARAQIKAARALLDTLLTLGATVERENLYGSAFKRLAMIEAEAGDSAAERAALEGMKRHYGKAEAIAKETKAANIYYPAMNRMVAELALREGRGTGGSFRPADMEAARESLTAAAREKPDFWNVVGQTELDMYEALSARALSKRLAALTTQLERLHERVPQASKSWASVYDNATFVLQKYRGHAPTPEKKAAADLLAQLKSFVTTT